jgi:hypothetical protein
MNKLILYEEQVVAHQKELTDKRVVEARVILVYRDKYGYDWECNKVIKCRVKRTKRGER